MADEQYFGSPVGALAPSGGGALQAPALGLVLGRAGVGKTALLVHVALAALLAGRQVLHVSLRDTVDHARAHYDEIVRLIGDRLRVADAAVRIERGRMIHSYHARAFEPALVGRNLAVLAEAAAQFHPDLVLIDGFDSIAALTAQVKALKALALDRKVVVWAAVRSEAVPADGLLEAFAVTVRLVADERGLMLHPVRGVAATDSVAVDAATLLRAAHVAGSGADTRITARECTLYAGGASGAEAAFGEAAERLGMHEVNLTFDGHLQARTRGRYELSPKELAMGDVSLAYVSKRLNRTYSDQGALIRGVLQTLWHMVSRSQQVFVVGRIQEDGTVVGGTGWSVELARMWNRDLWVFDQEKGSWYRWDGGAWASATPRITSLHVCGTGTRYLDDGGRRAIAELFARSF